MKDIIEINIDICNKLLNIPYKEGDLSDIGNEIGIILGKYIDDNKMGYDLISFISGIKHGISLTNGTHDK